MTNKISDGRLATSLDAERMQRSDCAFVACWPKPRLNLHMSGTETAVGDEDVAAGRPCEGGSPICPITTNPAVWPR
jgi:hypothetical protein